MFQRLRIVKNKGLIDKSKRTIVDSINCSRDELIVQ